MGVEKSITILTLYYMTKEREKHYTKYCHDCQENTKEAGLLEKCLEYNYLTGKKKKVYLCNDCLKKYEKQI